MRIKDLDHQRLLELDPAAGTVRFAGQRALILDAVAMGLLRKYLVENFGYAAARVVLTQFGFAHGWRMADAMKMEFDWENPDEWRLAGTHLNTMLGLYALGDGAGDPLSQEGALLLGTYEAEQHLLHFGRSDEPTCWTICGLTSGYMSRAAGHDIFVLEDRCAGKGDAGCHLFGRSRDQWGEEHADELSVFESNRLADCLDISLLRVTETLKAAEQKLRERKRLLKRAVREVEEPLGLIAKSPSMRKVVDLAKRVARVDSTVLITGESGAGKERIARLLHEESTRASGPFIAVNCGAITETLLEGELFGHARGAFTGATQDRLGLFEAANGGTLLLDEVGEVSQGMQVKLLRALQEREIRRVGETKSRKIDVRIVAATNRDLAHGVQSGGFRQDLYYRLKVVELHVPSLRERREDLLALARVLLAIASQRMQRRMTTFSPRAADQLLRYDWPGNVRELENAMERVAALSSGSRVELEDLPEEVRHAVPLPSVPLGAVRRLEDVEKEYILAALAANGGNQTHTAEQLEIGSVTLYRKLKRYGVQSKQRTPSKTAKTSTTTDLG